jgi:hypothetical protein
MQHSEKELEGSLRRELLPPLLAQRVGFGHVLLARSALASLPPVDVFTRGLHHEWTTDLARLAPLLLLLLLLSTRRLFVALRQHLHNTRSAHHNAQHPP